jgi:ATP-dependent DNA helicase PIF1
MKYLFKYIYKGHDTVDDANVDDNNGGVDEIKQYRDARWVTPPEALWRIYGFDLSENDPPVMQLQLHLPGMNMVGYQQNQNIEDVLKRQGSEQSMLTEYLEKNKTDEDSCKILYSDFLEFYTWNSEGGEKYWKKRKKQNMFQVRRIVQAHPAKGERYYLWILLNSVVGARSFKELRMVKDVEYHTFCEAAETLGLIDGDNSWDDSLKEATIWAIPPSIWRLFIIILVFGETSNVRGLWDKHLEAMGEDYRHNNPCKKEVEQLVLIDVRDMLQLVGKDIQSFPLPLIDSSVGVPREIYEERIIEVNEEDKNLHKSLNTEQMAAYKTIMSTIDSPNGGVFFIDGPGGIGKTFLYRALLGTIWSQDKIAIATATSGVAASIMPDGWTAHSRFKIPINIDEGGYCSFTKQSGTAKLLCEASLILWDEASMTKRHAIEALGISVCDILDKEDLPFGGKIVVFDGDFRQTLPVVQKESRAQIIDASLHRSYIWDIM